MDGCLNCKHYFNTFDAQLPRGCRAFKLKSKSFPSELVKKETGEECQGFELSLGAKKRKEEKSQKKGLNDDGLW